MTGLSSGVKIEKKKNTFETYKVREVEKTFELLSSGLWPRACV